METVGGYSHLPVLGHGDSRYGYSHLPVLGHGDSRWVHSVGKVSRTQGNDILIPGVNY